MTNTALQAAFDEWTPTMYLANATSSDDIIRTWNPDQIIILTDGLCASSCALFVEMMKRAGVRTVVGPQQAAAGTRGAVAYTADKLDDAMSYARSIDTYVEQNANATIPDVRESGIYYEYFSINLRDQVRKDETTPLQFKYEAADCRVWYTMANLYNMTRLWHDVYAAAFLDASLCVKGSTGFSTTNNTNPARPPTPEFQQLILSLNVNDTTTVHQTEWDDNPEEGLRGLSGREDSRPKFPPCLPNGLCQDRRTECRPLTVKCSNGATKATRACLPTCRGGSKTCPGYCQPVSKNDVKVFHSTEVFHEALYNGLCYPEYGNRALGCSL
jgi:hypothetical protein